MAAPHLRDVTPPQVSLGFLAAPSGTGSVSLSWGSARQHLSAKIDTD
jgi:hypothetical protein